MVIMLVLFANSLTKLEYDMNIYEYMTSNNKLKESDYEYLKSQGSLVYGADHNSPPLRYVNENTGQYEGLSIDYISALSMELGVNIEFKPLMWQEALNQLKTGQIDLCDMYPSEERGKDFLFSMPIYYQRGAVLIKKTNESIKSVQDLENKRISANAGDYVFEYLNENFNHVTSLEATDLNEAIQLLLEEKVDAVLGDESVMNYLIDKKQLKNDYIILKDYLYEKEAVLAVDKDNEKLLNIFNKAIANLNKKQTMENINNKWFGSSPLITKNSDKDRLFLIIRYVLVFTGIFIIGLYLWNLQLKKEVSKQTKQIRVSKNELETVFNGLTHLMLIINQDCKIVNGNKAFSDQYNLDQNSISGKHCHEISGILGSGCTSCIIKDTFEKKASQTREIKYQNRIYKVTTYILEVIHGMKENILVMMEDITEFKITKEKMLQSTKMAAVGQLAAGIAHEIRTPLGIIRNHLYYMNHSKDAKDHKESLEIIESSVSRSNKIIDNLLNFSKLTDQTIKETNIYDLIQNIHLLNKKYFSSRNIRFNIACPEDLVMNLNTESLKHVMINLVNNSVDAIKANGEIKIDVTTNSEFLSIIVSDNGKGMAEDELNKVFDPFYTTKEEGTGLGLYITFNEVQKMHGSIEVSSQKGQGTSFIVLVPHQVNS